MAISTPMQALRERFDPTVTTWPGATLKTMFGHPGYAVQGKFFAFFDDGEVVVKAPTGERETLLTRPGAFVWTPPGSGMTRFGNWVSLPESAFNDDELSDALASAYEALATAKR
jgi:TfoX/Sxy family transcriptional regulator of competence genes